MKQLTISIKTSTEALADFKLALKKARIEKQTPHYEISFDNRKDFDRFVRNIHILSNIITFKPKSVYELAKLSGVDVSNLNKIILFFEEIGAIHIREEKVKGRTVRTPIVDYDRIEFNLAA
jgi:predicted transcriptional regulator